MLIPEANFPEIATITVGSYPVPDWLVALPSEQALVDATRVVRAIQENAGIDLPTDGELYRFDANHPDTNGMIEYFIRPLDSVRTSLGRKEWDEFQELSELAFRAKPAGVAEGPLAGGALNLPEDCRRVSTLTKKPFKFHRHQSLHDGQEPLGPALRKSLGSDNEVGRNPCGAGCRIALLLPAVGLPRPYRLGASETVVFSCSSPKKQCPLLFQISSVPLLFPALPGQTPPGY